MALKGHRRRNCSDTITAKRALYYQMPSGRCELPGVWVYLCFVSSASLKKRKEKEKKAALELKHLFTQAICDLKGILPAFCMDLNTRLRYFLVVDVPEFLHLLQCCADTWNVTCWLCLLLWKKKAENKTKKVSTLNAVFYWTSCGSLHHLQTHDLSVCNSHWGPCKKKKKL